MTATLAALFIEEGRLNWTTTLGELFGGTVKNMHPDWRSVTLQQVLAHRGGFRRDPPRKLMLRLLKSPRTPAGQRREIAATVLLQSPRNPPGRKEWYSNLGYILVGSALEQISGLDWEELMRERLFQPLSITSAGFGVPGSADKIDQPWGHQVLFGKGLNPSSPKSELPLFYGPAGLVHMNITDWAKFVALHLRGDPANSYRQSTLLKADTLAMLHPAGQGPAYSSGWCFETKSWASGTPPGGAGRILWHNGSNGYWYASVTMAPEIDFAVLTACNRFGVSGWKACARAADALIHAFASGGHPSSL
jgi:CubicO group peptidase (beta-lactamase class C family)